MSLSASRNSYLASPSYTLTLRLKIRRRPGTLAKIISLIGKERASVGAIDVVETSRDEKIRDITVQVLNERHGNELVARLNRIPGIRVIAVSDRTFLMHLGGKIEMRSRVPLKTRDDLSMAYTPGVARVCMAIHENRSRVWALSMKKNTVAIVTDGSAVLGLGNIGPEAALPVMEGKAILFKNFGGVDAFPICLATQDTDEIVRIVQAMAPGFGGINLEDISAPRCFEIENRLRKTLDIPVFHDDQHGTAVVVLAALFNALRIVKKSKRSLKIVMTGVGAAGMAVARILIQAGIRRIIGFDRAGPVYSGRMQNMNPAKEELAKITNPDRYQGSLKGALSGADVFIGLSGPGLLKVKDLSRMAKNAVVFALANPDPEVPPLEALRYARIVATGRSDYANQINNALVFPGVFRGALDVRARTINEPMKLAAALALASVVGRRELREDYIIPSIFNPDVGACVASAVRQAAIKTKVARKSAPFAGGHNLPAHESNGHGETSA
ncbi:MAG: NAD-dependent malic enzyme [Elusimicrobia bacterium]|nr:NAD-dependent malic enzyme [Elusimicrobiota bacterium]